MAPSGEVGPTWEVTCPHLGSGQGPCPSLGSDLSSSGCGHSLPGCGHSLTGCGHHFPDVGITSRGRYHVFSTGFPPVGPAGNLAILELEPHAPNTYQSKLVLGGSINSNKCE